MDEEELSNLKEEISELRRIVSTLSHIIHFHKLNHIDIKYRKYLTKENEYPFFELENHKHAFHGKIEIFPTIEETTQAHFPPDHKEKDYEASKKRMLSYAEEANRRKSENPERGSRPNS